MHWENTTEAFLKPFFLVLLPLLPSFRLLITTLEKRPETRLPQQGLCRHRACSGEAVLMSSFVCIFQRKIRLALGRALPAIQVTQGGNRHALSVHAGALGGRAVLFHEPWKRGHSHLESRAPLSLLGQICQPWDLG